MRQECISCCCGHRGIHRNSCVHLLGQLGNTHDCELVAMQQMPTLPERFSYLTCRPQKGSVFPRPGWTWRSTVPSCWWSGRYIGLWREANWKSGIQNNPWWLFRKVHSSCLKFKDTVCNFQCCMLCPCRQQQLSCCTDISVFPCVHSTEVNHHRNDASTTTTTRA